jgi:hypothetical protein
MKTYKISSLLKIEGYEDNGKVVLIIFLIDQNQAIEADYLEFNHLNGEFTTFNYR